MQTLKFEDHDAWLAARRGKITGSTLKDIIVKRGTKPKIGYYQLIAERIATEPDNGETPMERGTRLEDEAIQRFMEISGKKVNTDLVIWMRDDDESIALSPDGYVGKTQGVEVKCLSSARHIEAWLTQKVPDDYKYQVLQYFIVNDGLKKLYFVFYDPRIPAKDCFYLEINRKDVQEEIDECLEYERKVISEVNDIVNNLTF